MDPVVDRLLGSRHGDYQPRTARDIGCSPAKCLVTYDPPHIHMCLREPERRSVYSAVVWTRPDRVEGSDTRAVQDEKEDVGKLSQSKVVGPVGFEPTTSGPKALRLLGVASAPGSPRALCALVSCWRNRVPDQAVQRLMPSSLLDDGPTGL